MRCTQIDKREGLSDGEDRLWSTDVHVEVLCCVPGCLGHDRIHVALEKVQCSSLIHAAAAALLSSRRVVTIQMMSSASCRLRARAILSPPNNSANSRSKKLERNHDSTNRQAQPTQPTPWPRRRERETRTALSDPARRLLSRPREMSRSSFYKKKRWARCSVCRNALRTNHTS